MRVLNVTFNLYSVTVLSYHFPIHYKGQYCSYLLLIIIVAINSIDTTITAIILHKVTFPRTLLQGRVAYIKAKKSINPGEKWSIH
jgi:hypothetical protein